MQEVKGIRSMDTALIRVGRTVKYEENNTNTVIYGGTTNYGDAWDWSVESGDYFTEEDMASMARVAVIGKTVVNELYGSTDPIGTNIKIENVNFKVIGVLAPRGTSPMGMDMDSRIVIPYTTASRRVFNTPYVSLIRMAAVDPNQVEKIEARRCGIAQGSAPHPVRIPRGLSCAGRIFRQQDGKGHDGHAQSLSRPCLAHFACCRRDCRDEYHADLSG